MSGIYVHIPFCAKKCFYCDFYSVQSTKYKDDYLNALFSEIKLRKNYLKNDIIETIYLGGGTPSTLKTDEIEKIIQEIKKYHRVSENAEITVEVNPDDVDQEYVKGLKRTSVNRISIGLQSFFDDDLKLMNRRHNAGENEKAVKLLQKAGYFNISGDLIYGLPGLSTAKWKENLNLFFVLNIPHLSAYHLTYEPNTVFHNYLKKGKIKEIPEERSEEQFRLLCSEAEKNNFIHYETSNFAKEGFYSKHNTAYWQQKNYLGLGPAAHSYNGKSRQFNLKNLTKYIDKIKKGNKFYEIEILSVTDKYNDYLITSLRTIRGVDLNYINGKFGITYSDYIIKHSAEPIKKSFLIRENNKIYITKKGKFIEDSLLEKLFYVE